MNFIVLFLICNYMSNLITRSITGAIFVFVVVASILYNHISFGILFLLITILGLKEFYSLAKNKLVKPNTFLGIITGLVVFSATYISIFYSEPKYYYVVILAVAAIFIAELYRKNEKPFDNIAITLFGVVYVALPFSLLNYLYAIDNKLVLSILIFIWASDSGAYIFGSMLGKRKLFERISPKKSWEGSIGGALTAVGAAYIISMYFTTYDFLHWSIIAVLAVIFGTLGDLVESMYKRSINIKDSGTILPGHGGILDRFDACLIAIPVIFAVIKLFF